MPRKNLLKKECGFCGREFETKHKHQKTCSIKCGTSLLRADELKTEEAGGAGIVNAWACGGGVQSTAIAALIYLGRLPKPHFSWVVDVGYENARTFDYVEQVIKPKMQEVHLELNIIKTRDYLENSLFDKDGNAVLPLFEKLSNGVVRKFKTHCSGKWKQLVAHRWLRSQGVRRCDTWIGISVDESRRMRPSRFKWNQNKYPLIELGIRREDCIDIVARMGWPKPEHTSCYLCPNQTDYQWQYMKQKNKGDWEKALATEEYIQSVKSNLFLHGSCIPLKDKSFSLKYLGGSYIGKECFGDCVAMG